MDQTANPDVLLENAVSVETNLYASYVLTKQWRWARTKIRNLLDLGVSLKTAIQHGVSSKRCAGRESAQWTDSRLRTAHGKNPSAAAGTVECVVEDARLGQR